jgi:hypothetical protein
MKMSSRILLWGLIGAAACYCGVPAGRSAETGITIEAVDKYSCGALSQNRPNVDNFRSRMLSISGYTAGVRFTDSLVFPTDFTDPQRVSARLTPSISIVRVMPSHISAATGSAMTRPALPARLTPVAPMSPAPRSDV